MDASAKALERLIGARTALEFISNIKIQAKTRGKIRGHGINLVRRRKILMRAVALYGDGIRTVQRRAAETEIGHVRGRVGRGIVPSHDFVAHQSLIERGKCVARRRRPERPERKL